MRSLIVLTAAAAGAWLMVHFSQGWAMALNEAGGHSQSPIGALLFVPALLVGALLGAVFGSLVCPFRS